MSDEGAPPNDPPPPAPDPEPLPAPEPVLHAASTPWEDQGRLGIATAFVETTRLVLTSPAAFFRAMSPTGAVGAALAYGVLVGMIGVVASTLYLFVFESSLGSALRGLEQAETLYSLFPALGGGLALVGQIAFAPVGIVIRLFVLAGVVHLALLLLGGAGRFETTLRVVSYAEAPAVVSIIPICGSLLTLIYQLVVLIIGLAEAHRVGRGKAAAAVLVPLGLLCCCCIGLVALAMTFFGMALHR